MEYRGWDLRRVFLFSHRLGENPIRDSPLSLANNSPLLLRLRGGGGNISYRASRMDLGWMEVDRSVASPPGGSRRLDLPQFTSLQCFRVGALEALLELLVRSTHSPSHFGNSGPCFGVAKGGLRTG